MYVIPAQWLISAEPGAGSPLPDGLSADQDVGLRRKAYNCEGGGVPSWGDRDTLHLAARGIRGAYAA